jgi:hypothetical protein
MVMLETLPRSNQDIKYLSMVKTPGNFTIAICYTTSPNLSFPCKIRNRVADKTLDVFIANALSNRFVCSGIKGTGPVGGKGTMAPTQLLQKVNPIGPVCLCL